MNYTWCSKKKMRPLHGPGNIMRKVEMSMLCVSPLSPKSSDL